MTPTKDELLNQAAWLIYDGIGELWINEEETSDKVAIELIKKILGNVKNLKMIIDMIKDM